MPDRASAEVVERRVLDEAYLGGRAILEEVRVRVKAAYGDGAPEIAEFLMLQAVPAQRIEPVPVIVMETFCRNHLTIPHPDVTRPDGRGECDGGGAMGFVMSYVFGRYIATPPLAEILDRGYAVAAVYPGDVVPDSPSAGPVALTRLSSGYTEEATRWGAVAAWAWTFSRALDVLESDDRLDREAMVLWGHSRYGKAALLAAAFDPRADGVIAHQSGTGGASLSRNKQGESVGDITESFPHWFSDTYANYAGCEAELPVDQHQVLALIAPRPVFLGNARRDVWSDPEGAFVSAQGASPVYELFGKDGLAQDDLKSFKPSADLVFFIRPGTHGITEEDWPAFLKFLDAHFKD